LFSTEYQNTRQNIVILFWKYLGDMRSEAWLNLAGKYINEKLSSVYSARGKRKEEEMELDFCG
jgi:hypothetical protein